MAAQLFEFDKQEIRIAAVMTGGVSLAIWTSGVAIELLHLVHASRGLPYAPTEYRAVLDLLQATATVDVVAGTSAGGLNGAFLALGLAQNCELGVMRDLWRDDGGLERLLRDPLQKDIPSLMNGEYFYDSIRGALEKVLSGPELSPADPATSAPVELLLTGTLWAGRRSSFTDDLDVAITEVDHDATFRFSTVDLPEGQNGETICGDLTKVAVAGELATAARCTSSFPAAFEPYWVTVDASDRGPDDRYVSTAGRANFAESQFVVDGGVLLNKPLRPALAAIYRQPAGLQVRRLLTYVVPDPGEPAEEASRSDGSSPTPPDAQRVLLNVVTRMRSTDSVSRELTEIRARNDAVAARRQARSRLAAAMAEMAGPLSRTAWDGYKEVRKEAAARDIGHYLVKGQSQGDGEWSERELVDALRQQEMLFIPCSQTVNESLSLPDVQWNWGHSTVFRLGEMTIDVLKRALWLAKAGSPERQQIVECRSKIHELLGVIRADSASLHDYWLRAPRGNPRYGTPAIPAREGQTRGPATNRDALAEWLQGILHRWDEHDPKLVSSITVPGMKAQYAKLHGQALGLAKHLHSCQEAIATVCQEPNDALKESDVSELQHLNALYDCLLKGAGDGPAVLGRMLRLEVVQVAFGGAIAGVEQQVELVQISAGERKYLTGIQAHHFGGFYRASWRMNDWLHGRMDATQNIVRLILSPERIRQLGDAAPTIDDIEAIAIGTAHDGAGGKGQAGKGEEADPDRTWLEAQWQTSKSECEKELHGVAQAATLPKALPMCAKAIAKRIQCNILREDLAALAQAIESEHPDVPAPSDAWLQNYEKASKAVAGGPIHATDLWKLWELAKSNIGSRRLPDEVGSDTFARTVAKATSVAANSLGTQQKPKVLATVFAAFRGYALAVWALIHFLTLRSNFGRRVVELVLAMGGVLLAVTIVVPGVPLGLTFAGVVLLFAGLTAAALRPPDVEATKDGGSTKATGWRRLRIALRITTLTRRLFALFVLSAIVLGVYIARDVALHGWASTTWTLVLKTLVVVVVALAGLWVAGAQRPGR